MTDKENIKALLDKITFSVRCNSIYATVDVDLLKSIVNVVNRKQAEIERLKTANDILEETAKYQARTIEAQTRVVQALECEIKTAKTEAIKEFAERLKENAHTVDDDYSPNGEITYVEVDDIDNLVKEMVGDEE